MNNIILNEGLAGKARDKGRFVCNKAELVNSNELADLDASIFKSNSEAILDSSTYTHIKKNDALECGA